MGMLAVHLPVRKLKMGLWSWCPRPGHAREIGPDSGSAAPLLYWILQRGNIMDSTKYLPFWNHAAPLMRAKLALLIEKLLGQTEYTLSEIYEAGDEEFKLCLDLQRGDISVLSIEFVLLDADVNGGEDGVGVKLDLSGYGALVLGGYAPYNYTPDAFTSDMAEVADRINQLDVGELAFHILNDTLHDKRLLQELEAA